MSGRGPGASESVPAPGDGLRLSYEEICRERDRLRGARSSFTRQLVPVSAGVTLGAVSAFSAKPEHPFWLWIAFGLLALMVVVSVVYSGMPAYRQLRASKETRWRDDLELLHAEEAQAAKNAGLNVEDWLPANDWYIAMIALERSIYGKFDSTRNRYGTPWWRRGKRGPPEDLQDALDRERTGVLIVQVLFVLVIFCLVASELF